jgi:hypothetical protein
MKNILFLFSMLFLFAACADDDTPVFPVDDDGPVTPEDTLVLHPAFMLLGIQLRVMYTGFGWIHHCSRRTVSGDYF